MVDGLMGLANIGNTCYINSILQILSHTPELVGILNTSENNSYNIEKKFTESWIQIRNLLWSDNKGIVVPRNFISYLHKLSHHKDRTFSSFQQNDTHELLLFIIETFHLSISKEVSQPTKCTNDIEMDIYNKTIYSNFKGEYSDILPLLYGVHINIMVDTSGNILSTRAEPFLSISTPIHNVSSVYDCIVNYCKPELLSGDNSYEHPTTGKKVDAVKHVHIVHAPNILIIHLNRWNHRGDKINTLVNADMSIDLSNIIVGKGTYRYTLYGICNHVGNANGGHYTSNVNVNDVWYNFNDTSVTMIKNNNVVTNAAYCFFYRRL